MKDSFEIENEFYLLKERFESLHTKCKLSVKTFRLDNDKSIAVLTWKLLDVGKENKTFINYWRCNHQSNIDIKGEYVIITDKFPYCKPSDVILYTNCHIKTILHYFNGGVLL